VPLVAKVFDYLLELYFSDRITFLAALRVFQNFTLGYHAESLKFIFRDLRRGLTRLLGIE